MTHPHPRRATAMQSEVESPEWNAAAEAQLRAIEARYFPQRRRGRDKHADGSVVPPAKHRRRDEGPHGGAAPSHKPYQPSPSATWTLVPPTCEEASVVKVRRLPGWASCPPMCRQLGSTWPTTTSSDASKVACPSMKFGGRIVYCRTNTEVEQATVELLHKLSAIRKKIDLIIPIGFDIEWKPVFRKGEAPPKAAVMQICVDNMSCYVMHIFHSGIPSNLKSLLEDESYTKVGLNIAEDARRMFQDYNVRLDPLEDLSKIANLKLGGFPRQWGLASLTERLTCKKLPKPQKIRMGNWEKKVLSDEELQYAATDAYVSWFLYEILRSSPDAKADDGHKDRTSDRS